MPREEVAGRPPEHGGLGTQEDLKGQLRRVGLFGCSCTGIQMAFKQIWWIKLPVVPLGSPPRVLLWTSFFFSAY